MPWFAYKTVSKIINKVENKKENYKLRLIHHIFDLLVNLIIL
jgi:hypothetical protein